VEDEMGNFFLAVAIVSFAMAIGLSVWKARVSGNSEAKLQESGSWLMARTLQRLVWTSLVCGFLAVLVQFGVIQGIFAAMFQWLICLVVVAVVVIGGGALLLRSLGILR
jgi:hypothetical protein